MVIHQFQDLEDIRKKLVTFREEDFLTDFTIVVEDKEFKAHKLLLALRSDYFRSMLTNDTKESRENKVNIHDITAKSMQMTLDYFYTSKLEINEDIAQDLLNTAFKLQLEPVLQLCAKFMRKQTNITNCLGILTIASRYNIKELTKSSFEYCLVHFEDLLEEEEFLLLDESILSMIISSDDLEVSNEISVFEAIIKWVEASYDERISSLENLVCHVRFAHIRPVNRLLEIKDRILSLKGSQKLHDLINNSMAFLCLEAFGEPTNTSWTEGPNHKQRCPLTRQQRIFIVGGWTNEYKPIANVERYDPYSDNWTEVCKMSKPRCGAGVNILEDFLYAIGGHDGENYLKSVEKYDLKNDTWSTDVSEMKLERTSLGVVNLDGFIYAIGGQNGSGPCADVERYDPETNTWTNCAPMKQRRIGAGVAVLNNLIYVMGGADQIKNTQNTLNTVEVYNPITDSWSYVKPMATSRKHLGCAAYKGKVYSVGGRADSSELDTAECYSPDSDTWIPLSKMSERRSGLGLVELNGLLYAVGGHNGDIKLKLVEAYDPCKGLWTIKAPLNLERLGGGLAVYSKFTH